MLQKKQNQDTKKQDKIQNDGTLGTKDKSILLTIFTGTYFFAAFAALSFAPILPFIQEDLAISKAGLGMFISILYLGALIIGFPAGWLSDRFGVAVTISAGLLIQGLFTGAIVFVDSFYLILVLLFIAGIGYGAVNPATSKGIVVWFTTWRATAMAVKQMGFTAGNMAAAAILPTIAEIVGWRKSIFMVALSVVICGIINYFVYPDSITEKKVHEDVKPAIGKGDNSEPVWKNREIIFWSILSIFFAAVQLSGTVYLAVYLVDCFSYSKVMAGMFLGITQGAGALGRLIWGRVSDLYFYEHREREIILVGFIAAAASIVLGILPVNTHFIVMGLVAVVFGFTAVGFNVLFLTLIGEIAGPEKSGQAIGFWVTIAYIGAVAAPPLFGYAADIIGYKKAWVAIGCLLASAMVYTVVYVKKNKPLRHNENPVHP